MTREEATKIGGENPDFLIQDLYEAIEQGNYPVWDVYVQVMDPAQAEKYRWNIFDMTKVWPHSDFPLRQIGRLTMNRNVSDHPASARIPLVISDDDQPRNYFTDIEQAAFSPSTMVPGFAPSADPSACSRLNVFICSIC